jgi:hypothetical protein
LVRDSLNALLRSGVVGFEPFGTSIGRDIDNDMQALVGVVKYDDRAKSGKDAFHGRRYAGRYAVKLVGRFVRQIAKGGTGQRRYIRYGREDVGPKPPPDGLQQGFRAFKRGVWGTQLNLSVPADDDPARIKTDERVGWQMAFKALILEQTDITGLIGHFQEDAHRRVKVSRQRHSHRNDRCFLGQR